MLFHGGASPPRSGPHHNGLRSRHCAFCHRLPGGLGAPGTPVGALRGPHSQAAGGDGPHSRGGAPALAGEGGRGGAWRGAGARESGRPGAAGRCGAVEGGGRGEGIVGRLRRWSLRRWLLRVYQAPCYFLVRSQDLFGSLSREPRRWCECQSVCVCRGGRYGSPLCAEGGRRNCTIRQVFRATPVEEAFNVKALC